jgi:hypothetical protein
MSNRATRYNKDVHMRLIEASKTDEEFVYYPEIYQIWGFKGDDTKGAELGRLLHDINKQEWLEDPSRPMLSAIAVSSRTMLPGGGFYEMARDEGRLQSSDEKEELAFWLKELKALRSYWRKKSEEEEETE